MEMLEKLVAKKKKEGKELDPIYKDSKMSMLKALKDQMSGMMGDDLKSGGMKKVEVAAKSPEELSEGLDTAKDLIGSESENGETSMEPKEEGSEDATGLSPEEIDQLEMLLAKLKKSKMME